MSSLPSGPRLVYAEKIEINVMTDEHGRTFATVGRHVTRLGERGSGSVFHSVTDTATARSALFHAIMETILDARRAGLPDAGEPMEGKLE